MSETENSPSATSQVEASNRAGVVLPTPGRFLLGLVDPLLEKTIYWRLNKAQVTVGTIEGARDDIVIPWDEMSFVPPNRLVAGHPELPQEAPLSLPIVLQVQTPGTAPSRICCHTHEIPGFVLKFDGESWEAAARGMHSAILSGFPDVCQEAGAVLKQKILLKNGGAIKLWFRGHCTSPWHILRFVVVDRESAPEHDDDWSFKSSPLLSLPPRVLDEIASHIIPLFRKEDTTPMELLDTLLMTNGAVADRLRGHVQWKSLKLATSLDGMRAMQLVSPAALEHLELDVVEEGPARDLLWPFWKRLLASPNLKSLKLADFSLLLGVEFSPSLTSLEIVLRPWSMGGPRFEDLTDSPLPPAIKKLSLDFFGMPRFYSFELSTIASLFPNLVALRFNPCPHPEVWADVSPQFLARIQHLHLTMDDRSSERISVEDRKLLGNFFSRFKNLKTLAYRGEYSTRFLEMCHGTVLPSLSGVRVRVRRDPADVPVEGLELEMFRILAATAPNLKYVQWNFFNTAFIDWDFLETLEYFRMTVWGPVSSADVSRLVGLVPHLEGFQLNSQDHGEPSININRAVFDEMVGRLGAEVGRFGGSIRVVDELEGDAEGRSAYFQIDVCCKPGQTRRSLALEYPDLDFF